MSIRNAVAVVSVVAAAIPVAVPRASAGANVGVAAESAAQGRSSPFVEGEVFPDLAFPALDNGAPARMSDFRGKKVMLHVFASW